MFHLKLNKNLRISAQKIVQIKIKTKIFNLTKFSIEKAEDFPLNKLDIVLCHRRLRQL